jgi:hypothetical protein
VFVAFVLCMTYNPGVYVRQHGKARMKAGKLTLRLEEELIDRAKQAARERKTSVSKMVAGFFESIEDRRSEGRGGEGHDGEGGEITRRLRGSIRPESGESAGEQDYRRYLERKHGP